MQRQSSRNMSQLNYGQILHPDPAGGLQIGEMAQRKTCENEAYDFFLIIAITRSKND